MSALKHTYQVRGKISTLRIRTNITPGQWQPWAAVSTSLGLVSMALPQARALTCDHRPRPLLCAAPYGIVSLCRFSEKAGPEACRNWRVLFGNRVRIWNP